MGSAASGTMSNCQPLCQMPRHIRGYGILIYPAVIKQHHYQLFYFPIKIGRIAVHLTLATTPPHRQPQKMETAGMFRLAYYSLQGVTKAQQDLHFFRSFFYEQQPII